MSLTPDGHKYDPQDPQTIQECWIQSGAFPNLVRYAADPTLSPFLNDYIIMACAEVNRLCDRKFNKQVVDEIFANERLWFNEYRMFTLKQRPLAEVTNIWLQVVDVFSPIDLQYLQVDTSVGTIKILPTFSTYVNTTLPAVYLSTASNLWVRYEGGYAVDYTDPSHPINEVPFPVRMATALMVDYLFDLANVQGGVSNFRTQTYSQQNATPDQDPKLGAIKNMLKTFMLIKVA